MAYKSERTDYWNDPLWRIMPVEYGNLRDKLNSWGVTRYIKNRGEASDIIGELLECWKQLKALKEAKSLIKLTAIKDKSEQEKAREAKELLQTEIEDIENKMELIRTGK